MQSWQWAHSSQQPNMEKPPCFRHVVLVPLPLPQDSSTLSSKTQALKIHTTAPDGTSTHAADGGRPWGLRLRVDVLLIAFASIGLHSLDHYPPMFATTLATQAQLTWRRRRLDLKQETLTHPRNGSLPARSVPALRPSRGSLQRGRLWPGTPEARGPRRAGRSHSASGRRRV